MKRKLPNKRRKSRSSATPVRRSIQVEETPVLAGKEKYAVGYGKPPKHTQFKKGTSGNKKGRPKGTKNFETLFQEEINQSIVITENGQRRRITKGKAIAKQLTNKAATGDLKAIQQTMHFSRELGDSTRDPSQKPRPLKFELRVFEKDIATGERVRVKPMTSERLEEEEDDDVDVDDK